MNELSNYFHARPSFSEGIMRILDLGERFSEELVPENGDEADYTGLSTDWRLVGMDIQMAMFSIEAKDQRLVQQQAGQTQSTQTK
jgi:hypothetical protein